MSKRVPESKSRRAPKEDAPRANRSRAVAELLPAVGGAAFRRFGFVQSSIVSRWSEIVGERYAAASSPESIRFPMGKKADGVLTLVVRSAFAPMMQHIQPEIVERVNRFFGYHAVDRIVIRHGEVAPAPAKRAPAPTPRSPGVVPVELGQSLKTIADPELKAVLEALAGSVHATGGVPRIG